MRDPLTGPRISGAPLARCAASGERIADRRYAGRRGTIAIGLKV